MHLFSIISTLVMIPCFLSAIDWKKGDLLPESKAIIQTVNSTIPPKEPPQGNQAREENGLLNFTAATYEDSGMVPPDAMGVVGPTQFILGANGRIRSFDKKTGKVDHGIDVPTDLFFKPVSKGAFTSDSRIRYDHSSDKWYLVMLAATLSPVRIMLAVSDTGIITPQTKWSYFFIELEKGRMPDYPTLGIDRHALYIGVNIFGEHGYFTSDALVIQKKSLLEGTLKAFLFKNLVISQNFIGPTTPQGVDNFDRDSTEGYFIGIDGTNKKLVIRRIKNPDGEPSISNDIAVPIDGAYWPIQVPQKGSLTTKKFMLQGFDNRLGTAHIRDNLLYTAHNVGVDNKGLDTDPKTTRDGCKWYQINMKDPDHPQMAQSGILYQPSKENDLNERYYWTPGVMTNGLQTMMLCCSVSGNEEFANGAYALRYSNDPLGTLRKPHLFTQSHVVYTVGFPPFENLRWGEYSQTSVDPDDNMTFWNVAEFSYKENSWGLQVIRIPARPPAKIVKIAPAIVQSGKKGVRLTISGVREEGSGFYDPGEGYLKRLKVEVDGATVESMKWVNAEQIEAVISTNEGTDSGYKIVKITNPDGQSVEAKDLLKIVR